MNELNQILKFFKIAEKLKEVKRYGATETMKVKESSADHSWKVALSVMILGKQLKLKLDLERAVEIALVHDLVEAIAGDVDYRDIYLGKITPEYKTKQELKAMKTIKASLPSEIGNDLEQLWLDYENLETREAKFVKALDKLESIDHLTHVGHKNFDIGDKIAGYADKAVADFPELKELYKLMKRDLKKEFKKGGFPWKKEYDD